jgi:uncharacterized Tic20 family protein
MIFVLLYLIVGALVAHKVLRSAAAAGEIDTEDSVEVALFGMMSVIAGVIWPLVVIAGALVLWVKKEAKNV